MINLSDSEFNTLLAFIASIIGSVLLYRSQTKYNEWKKSRQPEQKSQQQISVDTMVTTYEQALEQKDLIIKDIVSDRDYWKGRALNAGD